MATPVPDKLFKIRDKKEAKKLNKEQALAFHHTAVQLLFMATRAKQDIQTAVAFLTTRVKSPDEDNWGKLKQVLKYLNGKKCLELRQTVKSLGMLKWYVNGSHNANWDCMGTRKSRVHDRRGGVIELLKKTEVEHKKLHKNGVDHSGHVYAGDAMVVALYTSVRICGGVCEVIPGQNENSSAYQEQKDVEQKED